MPEGRLLSGPAASLTLAGAMMVSALAAAVLVRRKPPGEEPPAAAADDAPGLHAATPAQLALLKDREQAALAGLASPRDFGSWLRAREAGWSVREVSSESRSGYELRRYALAYRQPAFKSWPDIVASVEALGDQPGVTIDGLALATASDDAGSFIQARLTFSVRLRR